MTEMDDIFEKYAFFSNRKERDVFVNVLDAILSVSLERVFIKYMDRPNEEFTHLNDRTKKILFNLTRPDKIETIGGEFSEGGFFDLTGGILSISITSDQYNYELVESMKRFLSPIFPICVFRNPYIWGVDLYEDYDRERFFETRCFISRSKLLEDPEIDIFRRDDGIVYKFRFNIREYYEVDDGIRFLAPLFLNLLEAVKKKSYEGIEILYMYCIDRARFRKFEPRTKLGRDLKSALSER